jgi:hypothetical protein
MRTYHRLLAMAIFWLSRKRKIRRKKDDCCILNFFEQNPLRAIL